MSKIEMDLHVPAHFVAPQITCLCQGFVSRGVLVVQAHLLLRGAFVLCAAYDINPIIIYKWITIDST